MKKTLSIVVALGVVTGIGILVAREVTRRRHLRKIADHVADNGYETAHDVLYPGQKGANKKLRYGPVLPH
jgi:hypothetical protein